MQEIILIETDRLYSINNKLKDGWRVVSVTPIIKCVDRYDAATFGAYVVIEKDKENEE